MGDGGDIIIKGGGSVRITFNSADYEKEPGDPKVHKSKTKNLTRVKVTDDDGNVLYDSGTNDQGHKYEVRVSVK